MRADPHAWVALLATAICAGASGQDVSDTRADTRADREAVAGDWCRTQEVWEARRAAGQQPQPVGGGCPPLGNCDIPAVRDQFIPDVLTPHRTLRLHLLIFREDNGSNPAASEAEIAGQMVQMNADFAPWGITWEHTWEYVDDSTYRNGGNDGAMKAQYAVDPETQCNLFVINTGGGSYGTFPWDPNALTSQGGIVMDDGAFGFGQSVITHEMGHNVGLWHTHHGVNEVAPCSACWERADGVEGDTTGDRASDTPPTPTNFNCNDPGGIDQCSGTPWGDTLPEDYMSYSFCWSLFTPHQGGRMHCWIEVVTRPWMVCALTGGHETLSHDTGTDYEYGTAVDASGSRAVVGAPGDDLNGLGAGAAAIFTHNGFNWIGPEELRPGDGASGDEFGAAAAIDGVWALTGAPGDEAAGSAYLFQFDGAAWNEEQKLLGDGGAGDQYGRSVALSGDVAVVGAPFDDEMATDAGAAYVYRYDGATWLLEQKLTSPDFDAFDRFGFSVDVSGDVAIVSAYLDDDLGSGTGSAYLFRFDGRSWLMEDKITADAEAMSGDLFGFSVAIDGDVAVVGAYRYDVGAINTGAAFIFRYNGLDWDQEARVAGGGVNENLGWAVDVLGSTVVAGTPQDGDNGTNSGSAMLFEYDGLDWVQAGKLLAADGATSDLFGYDVAASDSGILVGSPFADGGATDTGAVYAFGGSAPFDCNQNLVPDGCDIADGTSFDLNANGIPDECEKIPCPWDLDGNGSVGTADLLELLGAWGPNPGHPADFDGSGVVATADLLALLGNWGPCL